MDAASMPFPAHSRMTFANRLDHLAARFALNRGGHRVEPGLYALGEPTPDSPVFVGANYTLSFDALRTALADRTLISWCSTPWSQRLVRRRQGHLRHRGIVIVAVHPARRGRPAPHAHPARSWERPAWPPTR